MRDNVAPLTIADVGTQLSEKGEDEGALLEHRKVFYDSSGPDGRLVDSPRAVPSLPSMTYSSRPDFPRYYTNGIRLCGTYGVFYDSSGPDGRLVDSRNN